MTFICGLWKGLLNKWDFLTYRTVNPIIRKGQTKNLDETSADELLQQCYHSGMLSSQLGSVMKEISDKYPRQKSEKTNLLTAALFKIHWKTVAWLILIGLCTSILKYSAAIFFRMYLNWSVDENASDEEGWLWGWLLIISTLTSYFLGNHFFSMGNSLGLKTKQALLGSLHMKILKLNTAIVSWQTTGQIVNFASNDLKLLDEGIQVIPYLFLGLFELLVAFILLGIYIGWLPSFLGLLIMILFVPIQGMIMGLLKKIQLKVLGITDKRINATSEVITGILAVKTFAWEESMESKIKELRLREHKNLTKNIYIMSTVNSIYPFVTAFVPFVAFSTVTLRNGNFDVPDAFFTWAILNITRLGVTILFPFSIIIMAQLSVSFKRLNSFLKIKEPVNSRNTQQNDLEEPKGTIVANIIDYGWLLRVKDNHVEESKKPLLHKRKSTTKDQVEENSNNKEFFTELKTIKPLYDIKFKILPGELVGIVGEVGSGKSSLLSALLGEMQDLSGDDLKKPQRQLYGSVSYCSQTPWILSGTVKDNILFSSSYEGDLYSLVINSCALESDLEQLPAGDLTELGERGINLSGGQKARISLARASYARADINLLDDPLSAVDPKVANILFERCIGNQGMMGDKTRLLVTHQVQFMPECDRIIIMDEGKLVAMGTYEEIMQSNHRNIFERLEKNIAPQKNQDSTDETINDGSSPSNSVLGNNDIEMEEKELLPIVSGGDDILTSGRDIADRLKTGKLVEKENKEIGSVSWRVYYNMISNVKLIHILICLVLLTTSVALNFTTQFWLYLWANAEKADQNNYKWYLGYAIQSIAILVLALSFTFTCMKNCLMSLTQINLKMLNSLLYAPLSFFHTNPSGRILNRFSKDQGMADGALIQAINDVLTLALLTLLVIVVVCIAVPHVIVVFPLFVYLVFRMSKKFLSTSREIRRFDGITRSPVYEQYSEHLKGLATIRAYGVQELFNKNFMPLLDRNGAWWYCYYMTSRWLALRLDMLSCFVISFCVLITIGLKEYMRTEFIAIAVTNLLTLLSTVQFLIRQYSTVENAMTGVERMIEYTNLEREPPKVKDGASAGPKGWPKKGLIKFENVSSRYRKDLPPVLSNLTFEIPPGSSVGIIGRTGSGKSSFLLTLYRLIEIVEGSIYLDDVNIVDVGIDALRKNLSIIPQDPVLFEGSLRFNLDPWNEFTDEELWDILYVVQLNDVISACGGLDSQLSEGGNNFSVGQRQLLCLARALLKDTKLLALDEATANVDNNTDSLIQAAIRRFIEHKSDDGMCYRTLFIIAHRIDTVTHCDLIMVFDNGRIVEFGPPAVLLSKDDSFFSSMLKASKEKIYY